MGCALKCDLYSQWDTMVENKFFLLSSYQLDSFFVRDGDPAHCPLVQYWELIWLSCVQSLCLLPQSLWVHMCVSLQCLEGIASFVSSILPGFCSLFASSSSGLPKPLGKWFDEDLPLRSEYSTICHSLHIAQLWVSVFIPIYCRRKHLWWWLSRTLIYGPSKLLLWVITLV